MSSCSDFTKIIGLKKKKKQKDSGVGITDFDYECMCIQVSNRVQKNQKEQSLTEEQILGKKYAQPIKDNFTVCYDTRDNYMNRFRNKQFDTSKIQNEEGDLHTEESLEIVENVEKDN